MKKLIKYCLLMIIAFTASLAILTIDEKCENVTGSGGMISRFVSENIHL